MTHHPFVTVAIPCLNEKAFIETCLRSVLDQDYARDRLEVLVADGMSVDGTRQLLARLSAEDPRIRVIDNPDRIQAAGLNAVLRVARGEVIVRMDAHCEYRRDYVRQCVEALARTGADNVGGAQRPRGRTFFQRALCVALGSPLGVGGAKYRYAAQEGFVDTVFLGAFRRRVFETVGLYDPRAVTNEDAELNQRLLAAGGRIYLSRDIVVHYDPRACLLTLARQYFRYGVGRARTLIKHRSLPSIRPAIPFLVVAGGAALLAASILDPRFVLAFVLAVVLYGVITGLEAWRGGQGFGLATVPVVWAIFPVLHVCHGLGFAAGLVRYTVRPDWAVPERVGQAAWRPGPAEPTGARLTPADSAAASG